MITQIIKKSNAAQNCSPNCSWSLLAKLVLKFATKEEVANFFSKSLQSEVWWELK